MTGPITLAGANPAIVSATGQASSERERLAEAARQFEAIFVRQMLTAARNADFGGEELFGVRIADFTLRAADLGYLHVHPAGHPGDGTTPAGPDVRFAVTAPGAGDYRLFFEFRHAGTVHRAELTVPVEPGTTAPQPAPEPTEPGHGH